MPWSVAAAGITAGGGILSGIMGGNAAKKAADAQAAAAKQALDFQKGVYTQGQANLQPYMNSGNTALTSLMAMLGLGGSASGHTQNAQEAFENFTGTPAYQFPLQQGNLALQRQLASSGLTNSGGALKDAIAYNNGFASQGFNSYLSQLGGLAHLGQGSASSLLSFGNQAAQGVSGALGGIGNAQAAGITGGNQGLMQAINGGITPFVATNPNTGQSPLQQGGNWLKSQFSSSYTPEQQAANPVAYGPYTG